MSEPFTRWTELNEWKARAEQAERDLAECRERIGHLTSANIECGRKVEQAERALAAAEELAKSYEWQLDEELGWQDKWLLAIDERDIARRALAGMKPASGANLVDSRDPACESEPR